MKKITVVGTGNVGLIHGAYLSKMGHEVSFLKTSNQNSDFYNKLVQEKEYKLVDYNNEEHCVSFKSISKNSQNEIENADIVLIATTTLQHEDVAKLISPHLKDGVVIAIMPSYASRMHFEKHIKSNVKFVEFETSVYNGRIVDSEFVNVSFENCRVAASFTNFSSSDKEEFLDDFFKIDLERNSSLEIALHNPNMIVHTIGMVLSSARIEYSKGEFWLYKEAFTESVINVIKKFDLEKNAILNALGFESLTYFDAAKWRNEEDLSKDSLEVFRSFSEDASKGPSTLRHRYLLEDVPMGLVLFEELGRILGINTPIATSIINLSEALLNENFRDNTNLFTEEELRNIILD